MKDSSISHEPDGLHQNQRIAVLGAGATGITIARRLNELGYTKVTVLEKEKRIGGKCLTVDVDNRPYDMGAAIGAPYEYDHVTDLTARLGIETEPFNPKFRKFYDPESGMELKFQTYRQKLITAAQTMKYLWLHKFIWKGVDGLDIRNASPELYATWQTVMEKRRLREFSRATRRLRTAFGYGYDDEIPAVYGINYFRPTLIKGTGLSRKGLYGWKGGTQQIWEKASKGLNIKTGIKISRIDRSSKKVTIHTDSTHQPMSFDRLVITFNPKQALKFLDATMSERMIYRLIKTIDYRTYLCKIQMPAWRDQPALAYLEKNMHRNATGRPMLSAKRHPDRDVAVFTVYGTGALLDEQVLERIGRDMQKIGGKLVELICCQHWDYFPHVDSQALKDGFYEKIDNLQGVRNTYVAGEILSFSNIARVMGNAVSVAERIKKNG
jgi:protoporphyrinogen oxidase